jgi:hypothetical protein
MLVAVQNDSKVINLDAVQLFAVSEVDVTVVIGGTELVLSGDDAAKVKKYLRIELARSKGIFEGHS